METIHATPTAEETTPNSPVMDEADRVVRRHVAWAAGGGFIPVPFVDEPQ